MHIHYVHHIKSVIRDTRLKFKNENIKLIDTRSLHTHTHARARAHIYIYIYIYILTNITFLNTFLF